MRLAFDLAAEFGAFGLAARADAELQGVTALFGPSGAGKSTILAAIAGFRPGLGRVAVDGEIWQDTARMVPPHRRPVGMVFQNGRLFDHMPVLSNLRYAARRADRSGPKITIEHAVEALRIEALLRRMPATLSGGERQRVAMARALCTRPRLMLMDEPLSALDRKSKADLLPMIGALPETFGIPVLFVSHQVEEISRIASQMIAINGGRVVGIGPLGQMLEDLDPEVTGRFEAGSLLTVEATRHDAAYMMQAVRLGDAEIWLPGRMAIPEGETVRLRLRARDVSVAVGTIGDVSIRNRIPSEIVEIVEESGPFAEILLTSAGQSFRARSTRLSVAELGLTPGMAVTALVKSVSFDRRLG